MYLVIIALSCREFISNTQPQSNVELTLVKNIKLKLSGGLVCPYIKGKQLLIFHNNNENISLKQGKQSPQHDR